MISTTSSANSGGYKTVSDARRFRCFCIHFTQKLRYRFDFIGLALAFPSRSVLHTELVNHACHETGRCI